LGLSRSLVSRFAKPHRCFSKVLSARLRRMSVYRLVGCRNSDKFLPDKLGCKPINRPS
jgi:hypothetical protein